MGHRYRVGREERRAYWAMVSPAFLLYLFVMAFPIVISVVVSLSDYGGGRMFGGEAWRITGLEQYRALARDPYFWLALKNNVWIVLVSVFGQLPLGLIFAYLIYRKIVKLGELWQAVLYMPAIISVIVIGIMWNIIFSPYGLIAEVANQWHRAAFLRDLDRIVGPGDIRVTDELVKRIIAAGDPKALEIFANPVADVRALILTYLPDKVATLRPDLANLLARRYSAAFLAKRDVAMLPILFVVLWCWTGMYLILFLANMQKVDGAIVEAARIDGASEGQVMGRVILPMLSGVVVNAAILCIAGSLNSFALVFAMTGGGPARVTQLLSIYMYDSAFMGAPNYPRANAIALAIVVFSLILIGVTKLVERRYGGRE
jgi:ABC-type sugar transport system permease subunit